MKRGGATSPEGSTPSGPTTVSRGAGGEELAQHPPPLAGRVVGGRAGRARRARSPSPRGRARRRARAAPVGALEGGLELAQRGRRAGLGRARDEHRAARRRARCSAPSTPLRTAASGSTTRAPGVSRATLAATSAARERVLARVDHGAVAARLSPRPSPPRPRAARRTSPASAARVLPALRLDDDRRVPAARTSARACARSSPTRRANVRPPAGNQRSGSPAAEAPREAGVARAERDVQEAARVEQRDRGARALGVERADHRRRLRVGHRGARRVRRRRARSRGVPPASSSEEKLIV